MEADRIEYSLNAITLSTELERSRSHFGMVMAAMHEASRRGPGILVTVPDDKNNKGAVETPLGVVSLDMSYSHDGKHAFGVVQLSHLIEGINGKERQPIGAFKVHPYDGCHDAEGAELLGDIHGTFNLRTGNQALGSIMQAQMRAHVGNSAAYLRL